LVAGLAATAATILCVSVLAILWVLGASSSAMDRAQNAGQTQLVRAILKTRQDRVLTALADDTTWIDLFNHLKGPPNPAWEVENLGPYLLQTFGIDDVCIVSRSGRVVYSYRADRNDPTGDTLPGSRMLQQLAMRAFAHEDTGRQRATPSAISGVISLDGTPAMAAAAVMKPTGVKTVPEFAMVEADVLTPAVTAALGKEYGISDLKIQRSKGPGIELMGPQNRASGFTIGWLESTSGRQLFHQVLPGILLISIVTALAFAGVALTWWRFLNDLKEGERRVLAAELEAAHAQAHAAEETSRSKSAFIANMSHELRTPLNAIIGFSEVLHSEALGPKAQSKYREYIGDIHASGQHLLRLVNDILQLSKIEADKMEAKNEAVSAHEAIASGVRMVRILAAKRKVHILVCKNATSPRVMADSDLLQQILLNLLSNAVKFSSEGGLMEVDCEETPEGCVIKISDKGCGIPPETLAQLGKPFTQAEGAFARKYQGTGLGLAISFRLAEMIGASLAIDSTEGVGTTATLTLKLADPETEFRAA
jgi:signal transduction histidine kinase